MIYRLPILKIDDKIILKSHKRLALLLTSSPQNKSESQHHINKLQKSRNLATNGSVPTYVSYFLLLIALLGQLLQLLNCERLFLQPTCEASFAKIIFDSSLLSCR